MQLWLTLGQLVEQQLCRGDEHAGVPEILARFDVTLGLLDVRLLDKLCNLASGVCAFDSAAGFDVAKANRRLGRGDSDCHDFAGGSNLDCLANGLLEFRAFDDHVICRK